MTITTTRLPILSVRRAWALAIGIVLIHRLLMIVTAGNMVLRTGLNDLFILAASLGGATGMFYVARRPEHIRHIQIAWTLLGLGISLVVLGAAVYAILDILGLGTFLSIADGFYLMFYPVFGTGLILMSGPPLSRQERIKTLLDMAIVMLAAFLALWIVLIAPTLAAQQTAEPLTVAILIAFPICDWALIFAILRVLFSRPGHVRPIPLLLLACAAMGQVVGDVIYFSQSLAGTFVPGGWMESIYMTGFSLLIVIVAFQIAPQSQALTNRVSVNTADLQFGWAVYIPFAGVAVAYILLVWAYNHPFALSFPIMAWAVGGIIGLVSVRQIIAFQENTRLTRQLQVELVERKAAEQAVRRLNEDLERRVLERTAALTQEIAERQQVQVEREKLVTELKAKNVELERFTYTVSHDLKSPLITIKGFLGFLEQDAMSGKADRLKRDIELINGAADKMQQLLDELLELSRIGRRANPPQPVSMTGLAHEAAELVAGQLTARGVQVDIATGMPIVVGDRSRLREVYENLLSNAAKFMGDQAHPRVEVGVREEAGQPVFTVRDNGIGIAPQDQDRIFELFEKLDPDSQGTGIGLAIVKRIVETHGGKIWIESEGKERGSVFCFTLPTESR